MLVATSRRVGRRRVASAVLAAVLASSLTLLAGCSAGGTGRVGRAGGSDSVDVVGVTSYPLADRQSAPLLAGETLEGGSLSLQEFGATKIVVLNVWASWCGPCRSESPMLAAVAKSLAPQGVVVLGLDEQDVQSDAQAFAASTGMEYPNLVDKKGSLLRKLKMLPQMGIPSTLLLDRHGRIAARVIGPISSAEVTAVVDRLIAEV